MDRKRGGIWGGGLELKRCRVMNMEDDCGGGAIMKRKHIGAKDGGGVMEKKCHSGCGGCSMEPKRRRMTLDNAWCDAPVSVEADADTFAPQEYIYTYTTIGNMSANQSFDEYCLQHCYKKGLEDFLKDKLLPSLKQNQGERLLRSVVSKWKSYKRMTTWLSDMFHCLNNYNISEKTLEKLREMSYTCFLEMILDELQHDLTKSIVCMVCGELENRPINDSLVKGILDISIEVKLGCVEFYEAHFEKALSEAISLYYSKKAQAWIRDGSWLQYIAKVESCIEKQKGRVARYMHPSSLPKIVQAMKLEMIHKFADQIMNSETFGCRALLCDQKIEDLSKMFVLLYTDDDSLHKLSKIFKEHMLKELISLQTDAADTSYISNGDKFRDCLNQVYVYKVLKLHDKYTECVEKGFHGNSLFKKAMMEVFEVICNKDVADTSMADIFSTFCAGILSKASDEPTEVILGKVLKLLTHMNNKDIFLQFHRVKLEKRLPVDEKNEMAFLLKLKQYFGDRYNCFINEIEEYLTAESNQISAVETKLLGGMTSEVMQSNTVPYQDLEAYLKIAKVVSTDTASKLSYNLLVEEFYVPWGLGQKKKARYTLEGLSVCGGLVTHVTNAHRQMKSWNGKITLKMFFVVQGQIHIFPWALKLTQACTEGACLNDLKGTISEVTKASALSTPDGVVYPLHLTELGDYLLKLKLGTGFILSPKLATFVRCNPAFTSHSQKSCVSWHLRRFERSLNSFGQRTMKRLLNDKTNFSDWQSHIKNNPLFSRTFKEASDRGSPYCSGPWELCRFIRDWHTHSHEYFTEQMKIRYGFEILEHLAELFLGAYMSEILFKLLISGYDIDLWLSDLKPALPLPKDICKGG